MVTTDPAQEICLIIGASHAGVNCAFALRKENWVGRIILIDKDTMLPYHRPPLSKTYLSREGVIDQSLLKSKSSYEKEKIELRLGVEVTCLDTTNRIAVLTRGAELAFDKLVFATGARALIPPIKGIDKVNNAFPLRSAGDAMAIQEYINPQARLKAVVIGGGFIGLEVAASLSKLGLEVTVLERDDRILSRVTSPEMSNFFRKLHTDHDVTIVEDCNVTSVAPKGKQSIVSCVDKNEYIADIIIVGTGILVNTELAEKAGVKTKNGIIVAEDCSTNIKNIYAIGDCTYHYSEHYGRNVRLESVQNAVDQAKVAAANIAGRHVTYNTIPWFWSDQYDVKLQMVGLTEGYNNMVVRNEKSDGHKFSIWYYQNDTLLAVDAVNNGKAYVYGTKAIKGGVLLDKVALHNPEIELKELFSKT